MKEVVKLIEKVVTEKKIDRHQGLNAVLDFIRDAIRGFESATGKQVTDELKDFLI